MISGGAIGPDSWSTDEARTLGIGYLEVLPDWKTYGKQAGFIRNTAIVQNCDIVVAFMEALAPTNGTMDTVKKAVQMGVIVYVISNDDELDLCLSHIL